MAAVPITAANVRAGAKSKLETALVLVAVTAGQALALNADSEVVLFDADELTHEYIGFAVCSAAAGQWVVYTKGDDDYTPGGTVTEGVVYYLSTTSGGFGPSADLASGDQVVPIGIGKASNKLNLTFVRNVTKGALP